MYFFHSFFESLLLFLFFYCWFSGLSLKDKNSLNQIVNICCKMIGMQLSDLSSLWRKRMVQEAQSINNQPDHILSTEFFYSVCDKAADSSNWLVYRLSKLSFYLFIYILFFSKLSYTYCTVPHFDLGILPIRRVIAFGLVTNHLMFPTDMLMLCLIAAVDACSVATAKLNCPFGINKVVLPGLNWTKCLQWCFVWTLKKYRLFRNLIKCGICLICPSYPSLGPEWYLVRVELTVMDVNDNVPQWSMVPAPYLAVVSPDAPAGTLVYKLHAEDGDEGNSGEVEYFLSDGKLFFLLLSCLVCVFSKLSISFFHGHAHVHVYHMFSGECCAHWVTSKG